MNTTNTFPAGSHLSRLGDLIARTPVSSGAVFEAQESAQMRGVQDSPFIARRNAQNVQFALNAIKPEDMAEFLADYLIARFDKVRTSFIGRDIARIAETRK